jgi:predicted Zn-dependent peptidase
VQALLGDWRYYFQEVDRIDKVTKADIRRVANQTFVASNRDVGMIESTQMAGSAPKEAHQ